MSMLAEPRQRKRYNLVPRGKALYEDDNRFGTKMLEKMGWSKGKGLGANEDGSKDFVRIRYKNDANGFGYEDRDDQWTQHEESFNGLLKSLHGEEECANNVENDKITTVGFGFQSDPKKMVKLKEKFSGESLEEKSKNSKVRVHYKKFTRGKDLSRYSEKDLANIFGKRDGEEQAANGAYEQFQAFKIDNEEVKEEQLAKSNLAGVPTINTGLSVSDYFKQKMEAMKNKRKSNSENETKSVDVEDESLDSIQEPQKKKKKQKRSFNEETEETTEAANVTKKEKKMKQNDKESLLLNVENNFEEEATKNKTANSKKKSKEEKRKAKKLIQNSFAQDIAPIEKEANTNETIEETHQNYNCDTCVTEKPTDKLEKNKSTKTPFENMELNDEMVINENETSTKSSKSKRNSKEINEPFASDSLSSIGPTHHGQKNTKECTNDKKEKLDIDTNDHVASELIATKTKQIVSKKKNELSVGSNSDYQEEYTLEALKAKLSSYNIYTISTFCAEKFRNTDLTCFVGSSLSAIVGYTLSDKLQLDIKEIRGDQERITMLWNAKTNKYKNFEHRKNYRKYMKEASTLRKTRNKVPRINLKSFKRKDAFTGI